MAFPEKLAHGRHWLPTIAVVGHAACDYPSEGFEQIARLMRKREHGPLKAKSLLKSVEFASLCGTLLLFANGFLACGRGPVPSDRGYGGEERTKLLAQG
jgi:hypothetical protein